VLEGRFGRPFTSDLVVSEVYTLLRRRVGFKAAIAFLEALRKSGISVIFLDEALYDGVIRVLKDHTNRVLSFTDAFLLLLLNELKIDFLATYDERSFTGLAGGIIGRGYAKELPESEVKKILARVQDWLGKGGR